MSEKLHRPGDDVDLGYSRPVSPSTSPGKSTLTAKLFRRANRDDDGVAAGAEAHVERAAGSSGSALPGELRERFESSLGADLSGVRLHTGADSQTAASAVGAKAYTVGNDVHFGAGQYDPSSREGLFLIAHEVAHTVQQAGSTPARQHKLEVSSSGDSAEVEADSAAEAMIAGVPSRVSTGAAPVVQRQECTTEYDPSFVPEPEPDPANDYLEECNLPPAPYPTDQTPGSLPEINWNATAALAGDMTAGFDGAPIFFDAGGIDMIIDAQNAFAADWGHLQSIWSTTSPLVQAYDQVSEENRAALGLVGMPNVEKGTKPGVLEPNAMTTGGSLADTVNHSAPRGTSDDLTIADAKKYAEDGFKSSRTKDVEADLADFNGKAAAAKVAYEGVNTARITHGTAMRGAALSLEGIHKAEIEKEKKDKEQEGLGVNREKAVVMGYIGVAKQMFGAFEQFKTASSQTSTSTIAGQDVTTKAGAGAGASALGSQGGITGALFAPVEYATANAYDMDLFQIESGIKALEQASASIAVEEARIMYETAKAQADGAKAQIKLAQQAAFNADEARRLAFAKVAEAVSKSALEHNPKDPRGAAAAETLIKAIPAIELVIAKAKQIATVPEPGYSGLSGAGANECENLTDFLEHLGILRGTKLRAKGDQVNWEADLKHVQKLMSEHL